MKFFVFLSFISFCFPFDRDAYYRVYYDAYLRELLLQEGDNRNFLYSTFLALIFAGNGAIRIDLRSTVLARRYNNEVELTIESTVEGFDQQSGLPLVAAYTTPTAPVFNVPSSSVSTGSIPRLDDDATGNAREHPEKCDDDEDYDDDDDDAENEVDDDDSEDETGSSDGSAPFVDVSIFSFGLSINQSITRLLTYQNCSHIRSPISNPSPSATYSSRRGPPMRASTKALSRPPAPPSRLPSPWGTPSTTVRRGNVAVLSTTQVIFRSFSYLHNVVSHILNFNLAFSESPPTLNF